MFDDFVDNHHTHRETYGGFYVYRGDDIHELPEWLIPAYLRRNAHEETDEELSGQDTDRF